MQSGRLAGVRIGVDGFNLALARGTGVKTYARTLTHCLHDLGCVVDVLYGRRVHIDPSPILREIAFYDPEWMKPDSKWRKFRQIKEALLSPFGLTADVIEMTGKVVDRQVAATLPYFDRVTMISNVFNRATRHFKRHGSFLKVRVPNPPAIMHWTYPLPIRMEGARNIYTLHDLVPLKLPFATLDDKRHYYKLIKKCIELADHICTVSEKSKSDIKDMFEVDENKISNTYQSVVLPEINLKQSEDLSRHFVKNVYGFDWKGYFLFFGAIEPKKNVGRMIEAILKAGVSRPLVIIGDEAWSALHEATFLADYEAALRVTGAPRRLVKFSYVPMEHLVALVRGARAVMFPSLYEGFGLPILESMLMGVPVLTSTEGSTPEIAGDAALLVDPYDVDAIAAGIRTLDRDDALAADLAERGPKQAALFGIQPYLERLETMYAKVLDLRPS